MKSNLGKIDRILRAILGVVLMFAGYFCSSWIIFTGGIIFLTSVLSWCPIYASFRWSTKHEDKKPA